MIKVHGCMRTHTERTSDQNADFTRIQSTKSFAGYTHHTCTLPNAFAQAFLEAGTRAYRYRVSFSDECSSYYGLLKLWRLGV